MHSLNGLNYTVFGSGRPIVFLHGFLESISMWEYLALHELKRTCILVDIPGHGKSELTHDGEPSITYFSTVILKLLAELNVTHFDIVGHSMGGYIGLEMLQSAPKDTQLVLLNSNFWADSEEKKKDRVLVSEIVWKSKSLFLKTAIPNLFYKAESYKTAIEELIQEALELEPIGIAYASLAMRNRLDHTEFVEKHSKQIFIIQGKNDPIVPLEKMETNINFKENYKVINSCGHMAHIEQSEIVLQLLKEFLD